MERMFMFVLLGAQESYFVVEILPNMFVKLLPHSGGCAFLCMIFIPGTLFYCQIYHDN